MKIPKKDNSDKTDNTTGSNKPKTIGKGRKTQKIPEQNQAIQAKQNLPEYPPQILTASRGRKLKDK